MEERAQFIISDLCTAAIKRFHKWIVIYCMYYCIKMANSFPAKLGVSQILSPMQIITGCTLDFKTNPRAQSGTYLEASYDRDITNNMEDRRHGCISVGLAGNNQGLLKCLHLLTGLVLIRNMYDVLPMPDRFVKLPNEW